MTDSTPAIRRHSARPGRRAASREAHPAHSKPYPTMNHTINFEGDWSLHGIMSDLGVNYALSPFHRIGFEIDDAGIQALAERVSSPGAKGVAEVADFLLLQLCNRFEPLLAGRAVGMLSIEPAARGASPELHTLLPLVAAAVSRVSGWTAHVLEQYANNRLIRPRMEYIGPSYPQQVVPLHQR